MTSKQKTVILIPILILLGIGIYFLFNTDTVRRQTSRMLQVEFIPNQHFDISQTVSVAQKDSIYKDFRKRCPFHFQMVGVGKFADSSYLFIISEPAAYIQADSIAAVFRKFNIQTEIKTHPIGYDGWVKDMVVCVGRATAENITNLNKSLSKLLYLSDYKPYTVTLPMKKSRVYYSNADLNYRISLAEINQWFIEDKEPFVNLPDTSKTFSIPTIFKAKKAGVFYSRQPGFVIWSINKKQDIQLQKENVRKFTLDADLILGAVSDSSTLVIIGRERESDIMELPPLNVETVLLLAAIKDGELSQSLDINDLLAGKMTNDKDWCPTYLSPQLENTEFGHLLTVTDILLKDWSENGTLQYESYDYPKPSHFPFDKPLFSKLGLNELVYNWNTANTMFAYDYDGMNLYALNRTGSLPVSYFNSQAGYISAGYGYENTAYNYFSGLCNTDLIRVVQYTSLYQLFIDNKIINSGDTTHYAPKNKPYLLSAWVKKLLTNIKSLSPTALDTISQNISAKNYTKFEHSQIIKQLNDWEKNNQQTIPEQRREEIIKEAQTNSRNALRHELSTLQAQLKSFNEQDFTNLCRYLSYPRGTQLSNAGMQRIYRTAYQVINTMYLIGKPNFGKFGIDLAGIKNFYSNSLKNSCSPWMKTPSLIISYNSPRLTGGHNLSSGIRRVNSINADKAIINSGRPQYVPRGGNNPNVPSQPRSSTPSSGNNKPKVRSTPAAKPQPNKAPTPTAGETVRKRSEVVSGKGRTQRGF